MSTAPAAPSFARKLIFAALIGLFTGKLLSELLSMVVPIAEGQVGLAAFVLVAAPAFGGASVAGYLAGRKGWAAGLLANSVTILAVLAGGIFMAASGSASGMALLGMVPVLLVAAAAGGIVGEKFAAKQTARGDKAKAAEAK